MLCRKKISSHFEIIELFLKKFFPERMNELVICLILR